MEDATSGTLVSGVKRRILLVAACPFPWPRGTPVRIHRMAEELGRRGHDVHVATYHLGNVLTGAPFEIHRIANIPTYRKVDPGPSYQKLAILDPLLALKVARVAARIQPDVIHAHHYEGLLAALPAKALYRTPVVFDAHVLLQGELEYYSIGFSSRLRHGMAGYLDEHLPRRADHVAAISQEIRDRFCSAFAFPESRISVVANGVEEPFFHGSKKAFRNDGLRRLVFTGNLASYQGADLMLDAFAKVAQARKDVRLVIVTDSDTSEFYSQARARGVLEQIEFRVSNLEELPSLLASADIALNPRTLCPGVPMKLLNYMAAATPIVSFAGSGKYLENERSALVIEDGDTTAFAAAIVRLIDDPQLSQRLGMAAQSFARRNLTWARTATDLEAIYDRVISEAKLRLNARMRRRPTDATARDGHLQ
jgi:glycosyltransferase involved in cell wall biosynthesis